MPLKCSVCNLSFHCLKSFRNDHIFYHKDKDFICSISGCGARYALYNSFKRHYIKHHDNMRTERIPSQAVPLVACNSGDTLHSYIATSSNSLASCLTPEQDKNETFTFRNSMTESLECTLSRLFSTLHDNPQLPNNVVDSVYLGIQEVF